MHKLRKAAVILGGVLLTAIPFSGAAALATAIRDSLPEWLFIPFLIALYLATYVVARALIDPYLRWTIRKGWL